MVIENTAFAADVALHLPDKFHRYYNKNGEWQNVLVSAVAFVLKTGLLDDGTAKAINLVCDSNLTFFSCFISKVRILS